MTGGVLFAASQLTNQDVDATPAGVNGITKPGSYEVELVAGEPVPLNDAYVYIDVDGDRIIAPLSEWVQADSDGNHWRAGERICLVGDGPHCASLTGKDVSLTLVIGNSIAVEHRGIVPPQRPAQQLTQQANATNATSPNGTAPNGTAPNGTEPNGTSPEASDVGDASEDAPPDEAATPTPDGLYFHCARDPILTILGTNITYGRGGPDVDVQLELDNGTGYQWLFGSDPIEAGWSLTPHIPADATLSLRGTASHHRWSATYAPPDPHVVFLRDGDTPPNPEPFDGQEPLSSFLAPYIDTGNQTMILEPDEVIVLMEFARSLSSSAADFQDAVVLIDIGADPCPA